MLNQPQWRDLTTYPNLDNARFRGRILSLLKIQATFPGTESLTGERGLTRLPSEHRSTLDNGFAWGHIASDD